MATSKTTINFLLDQLSGLSQISIKSMFGEYCLYVAGKPVGFVCNDELFLKPTDIGQKLIPKVIEGLPYPNAKPHLCITADLWEDRDWLSHLIQASANALLETKLANNKIKVKT